MQKDLDYTKETFLEAISNGTALISQHLADYVVIPVLGNHDYFPRNQLPAENSEIYNALAELWRRWLPGIAFDTFKDGESNVGSVVWLAQAPAAGRGTLQPILFSPRFERRII